jgi:hypothetical protein
MVFAFFVLLFTDNLFALPGWFKSNGTGEFLPCIRRSQCTGGQKQCAVYRTGPLCALCQPGYTASPFSDVCAPCPETGSSVGVIVLVFAVLIGV